MNPQTQTLDLNDLINAVPLEKETKTDEMIKESIKINGMFYPIIEEKRLFIGPFVIISLKTLEGNIKGNKEFVKRYYSTGISRCSDMDNFDQKKGEKISYGRAISALKKKIEVGRNKVHFQDKYKG